MPAGIVKTPISSSNGNQNSAERTSSGGRKFVQTRLPFKLIAPGSAGAGGTSAPVTSSASLASAAGQLLDAPADAQDVQATVKEPRKRKLSYGDETPLREGTGGGSSDQLRRSNSKENLDVTAGGVVAPLKKAKTAAEADAEAMAEDVIELDTDNDDADKGQVAVKEPRETKATKASKEADSKAAASASKEKPEASKSRERSSPAPPIQIKLPLVNKRPKRRKSLKKSDEGADKSTKSSPTTGGDSTDEIEAIAEELNPQKKAKIQTVEEMVELSEDEESKANEKSNKDQASKKDEPKSEPNKKSDQRTIDVFVAKKAQEELKEKKAEPKNKKKDQSLVEKEESKSKPSSTQKEDAKKEEKNTRAAKRNTKLENSQKKLPQENGKQKTPETNQTENDVEVETTKKGDVTKKTEENNRKEASSNKEKSKKSVEEPKVGKDTNEESQKPDPDPADTSVLLSSSEAGESSSDHEMDVDTDVTGRTPAKSLADGLDGASKTLTPKQQRLLEQRRKAREEKEQKLAEDRRLKQQDKEQREQQKKQEREEKEQQRKQEKDQKEQQRKTEREEKERKRQAEVDSKNEEKRKRNEAKEEVQRKKDEERRKKEQEREEAEQKKKRAAESFTKFFVPKQPKTGSGSNGTSCLEHEQNSCDSTNGSSQTLAFRPFQVKDDMLLAPVLRASLGQEQRSQLDSIFRERQEDDEEEADMGRRKRPNRAHLYISELSSGRRQPLRTQRDVRLQRRTKDEEDDDEVQVIGESIWELTMSVETTYLTRSFASADDLATAGLPIEEEQPKQLARMRAKYLQFADNRRPPYYGTWRKKSRTISARRPLAQDKALFDYELDSDCEWEEEEPGESLSASEDEKERESEEESEEEYNEWYVPHGHLSDEELQNDGDEMDDGHTREAQKAKLQVLQQEFAQEMKKQTKKIKPRLLGPVWLDENGNKSELFPAMFAHTIDMYACWQVEPLSLEPPAETEREDQQQEPPVALQLDERLLQQLVRLTHGNRNSKVFLINEYLEYLKTQAGDSLLPSKTLLREKFDELATWKSVEQSNPELPANAGSGKKSRKPKKRLCWVVPGEMLEKFNLNELNLHNQWDYTLTPKITEGSAEAQPHELSPPAETDASATPVPASSSPANSVPTTPITGGGAAGKKRAPLLMSVPRDQPIHTATKNALISQFLRRHSDAGNAKDKSQDKPNEKDLGKPPPTASEDVVVLSD
ncbi:hypothetical protein KR009_008872 [Drosophila setifemur]|nr:hypothetical protein KR009_008872 [Drosophila setifemur]